MPKDESLKPSEVEMPHHQGLFSLDFANYLLLTTTDWRHKEKESIRQKFFSKVSDLIGIEPTTSLPEALELLLSENSLVLDEMQVLMKNDYDFLTEIIHVFLFLEANIIK